MIEFDWKILGSQVNLLLVRMSCYHSIRLDIPHQRCGIWPYLLLLPEMSTGGCHVVLRDFALLTRLCALGS